MMPCHLPRAASVHPAEERAGCESSSRPPSVDPSFLEEIPQKVSSSGTERRI